MLKDGLRIVEASNLLLATFIQHCTDLLDCHRADPPMSQEQENGAFLAIQQHSQSLSNN
jgi:hypothetical protein